MSFFFTSHDKDLEIDGDVYSSLNGFQNTAIQNKSDLTVDNLDVMGAFSGDGITVEDLRAGKFDYAAVYLFVVNWEDLSQGPLKMRRGILGECVSTSQGYFQTELRGITQLLQQNVIELFGPECRADLFDDRCKKNKDDFLCTATVASVIDETHFTVTLNTTLGSPDLDNWFQYGTLEFTAGDNEGLAAEIKSWLAGSFEVEVYLNAGYPMQVGDTLNMWPGCDKSKDMCHDRYGNVVNMRAEPFLPGNDQILLYPNAQG